MEKMYHPTSMFEKIELYQDHESKWRWRISKNGRIIGNAPNGFDEKKECLLSLISNGYAMVSYLATGDMIYGKEHSMTSYSTSQFILDVYR